MAPEDRPRGEREPGRLLERVGTRLLLVWLAFVVFCAAWVGYLELTGWYDH
jgi:hypothetical protein